MSIYNIILLTNRRLIWVPCLQPYGRDKETSEKIQ